MKKILLLVLFSAFISSYGVAAPNNVAHPPHKISRPFKPNKHKRIIYGHDRARKKVKYHKQGQDYYSYANSRSYLRSMGRAINGSRNFR